MPIDQHGDTALQGVSIRSLPKVSLHDHLDGGVRPADDHRARRCDRARRCRTADADALADWFAEKSDSGSLVEYLKTFDLTTAVMQTSEGLTRVAREFVEDLAADGVIYGEVRWAPEQHLARGLSLEEVVEAVQAGIEEGEEAVEQAGRDIRVGQLDHRDAAHRPVARDRRARRRAGAAAAPSASTSPAPRTASCRRGTRSRSTTSPRSSSRRPCTPAKRRGSTPSARRSIDGRALRLGHGVRIAEDLEIVSREGEEVLVQFGDLARWVRDREIPLELSPSSNLQTGAIAALGRRRSRTTRSTCSTSSASRSP